MVSVANKYLAQAEAEVEALAQPVSTPIRPPIAGTGRDFGTSTPGVVVGQADRVPHYMNPGPSTSGRSQGSQGVSIDDSFLADMNAIPVSPIAPAFSPVSPSILAPIPRPIPSTSVSISTTTPRKRKRDHSNQAGKRQADLHTLDLLDLSFD